MSSCVLRDRSLHRASLVIQIYQLLKLLEKTYPNAFVDLAMRCHDHTTYQVSQLYNQPEPEDILRTWGFLNGNEIPPNIKKIVLNSLTGFQDGKVDASTIKLQDPREPKRSCCVIL